MLLQYYDPGDASHAKDRLDGYNLDGRNISVLYAQVRKFVYRLSLGSFFWYRRVSTRVL